MSSLVLLILLQLALVTHAVLSLRCWSLASNRGLLLRCTSLLQLLLLVLLLLLPQLVKLVLHLTGHLLVETTIGVVSPAQFVQAALDDVGLLLVGSSTVSC